MKKLLAITLVCVLLLAATPLALAQTVAPGKDVTVDIPFSGAAINLLHAEYEVSSGLTVKSGTVPEMMGGKAGKSMALFVSVPGTVSSGTLKLTLTAGSGASGDQTIKITELRGYAPRKWTDLTGKKTITIKVQGGGASADVNGDGKISLLDVMYVLRAYLGDATVDAGKCDLDGNGKVSLLDVMTVLKAYLSA